MLKKLKSLFKKSTVEEEIVEVVETETVEEIIIDEEIIEEEVDAIEEQEDFGNDSVDDGVGVIEKEVEEEVIQEVEIVEETVEEVIEVITEPPFIIIPSAHEEDVHAVSETWIEEDNIYIEDVNIPTKLRFEVYVGLGDESSVQLINDHDFETIKDAKEFGYSYAHALYLEEGNRDILDIMEKYGIDEDGAKALFLKELNDRVTFFIHEEYVDGTGNIALTRHHY